MSADDVINGTEPYILVEGPMWGDAEFYGEWLLAAAKAEALWKTAIKDPTFEKQIERLTVLYVPEFNLSASIFLFQVQKNLVSFTIPLNSEEWGEVEQFTMMAEMGFFVVTGQRYQMAIPKGLSMEKVKMAALKFAQTEDEECVLHPEYLIATMPHAEAKAWQERLRVMDEAHRCADRFLLLGG
jgi:hypothetical protein